MKTLTGIAFIFLIFTCEQSSDFQIYEGDLAFKLIDIGTSFEKKDSLGNITINFLDTLYQKDQLSEDEKYLLRYFEGLKKYELVGSPWIKVNFDSNAKSMTTVFLPQKEFEKIEHFNPKTLSNEGVKLRLKFSGTEILNGKIKAKELISFRKIRGETLVIK